MASSVAGIHEERAYPCSPFATVGVDSSHIPLIADVTQCSLSPLDGTSANRLSSTKELVLDRPGAPLVLIRVKLTVVIDYRMLPDAVT